VSRSGGAGLGRYVSLNLFDLSQSSLDSTDMKILPRYAAAGGESTEPVASLDNPAFPKRCLSRLAVASGFCLVKIVASQIFVGLFALEHMISNYQNRMTDGNHGFLFAASVSQAMKLRRQIVSLRISHGMRHLGQPPAQRAVPFARPPRTPFPAFS